MVNYKLIVSGAFALFIYLLFVGLFFLKFNSPTQKVSIAASQTEVFIDLTHISTDTPTEKISQPTQQTNQLDPSSESKSANMNHLFSDIGELFSSAKETKQVVKNAMQVSKEPVNEIPKKTETVISKPFEYKKEQREEISTVETKLSAIKDVQKVVSLSAQSKNNDPCFSKIYQIFSSKWVPSVLYANNSSIVRLAVYANGGLDYMIMKKSANFALDNNLKTLLDSERKNVIKECIGNNTKYIDITFTNKGI